MVNQTLDLSPLRIQFPALQQKDEQGRNVYQLTGTDYHNEQNPTDITSLLEGFITVTALAPEMTDHDRNQYLKNIFGK